MVGEICSLLEYPSHFLAAADLEQCLSDLIAVGFYGRAVCFRADVGELLEDVVEFFVGICNAAENEAAVCVA
jgi:hypothetical protein